jgi:hypothetical protein
VKDDEFTIEFMFKNTGYEIVSRGTWIKLNLLIKKKNLKERQATINSRIYMVKMNFWVCMRLSFQEKILKN